MQGAIYINNLMTRSITHRISDVILIMVNWDCYSKRSVHRLPSKHYTLYYVIIVHNYAVAKLCTSSKLKLLIVLWTPCCTILTILIRTIFTICAYFGLNIKCYGSRYTYLVKLQSALCVQNRLKVTICTTCMLIEN